jgi:hypothetical protein
MGFDFRQEHNVQFGSVCCPAHLYNGYRGVFPRGLKPQEREADHSPLSSAEGKNGVAVTPVPHASSMPCAYLIA